MTDLEEQVPLPDNPGVTGQTPSTNVATVERPPLTKLNLGTVITGLASTPARGLREAFAILGQLVSTTQEETKADLADTRAKLEAAQQDNTELRIANAVLKRDVQNQRDARRVGNLLILLGGLTVKLGSDHLATPELGGSLIVAGLAIIVAGFLLKPRDVS